MRDRGHHDPRLPDDPRHHDPRHHDPRYPEDPRLYDPQYQDPRYQDPRTHGTRIRGTVTRASRIPATLTPGCRTSASKTSRIRTILAFRTREFRSSGSRSRGCRRLRRVYCSRNSWGHGGLTSGGRGFPRRGRRRKGLSPGPRLPSKARRSQPLTARTRRWRLSCEPCWKRRRRGALAEVALRGAWGVCGGPGTTCWRRRASSPSHTMTCTPVT
ncbi:hypothetical protein E2C01_062765 [Portunus trituberculatus]|uniref:Uncharacterized protein n=1 Tax=Portunus trituberculatus TaxID=210409 RepID=A0A5B7HBZ8_PORTR|nr:hypothetical protein [Portunus trituberculatus]